MDGVLAVAALTLAPWVAAVVAVLVSRFRGGRDLGARAAAAIVGVGFAAAVVVSVLSLWAPPIPRVPGLASTTQACGLAMPTPPRVPCSPPSATWQSAPMLATSPGSTSFLRTGPCATSFKLRRVRVRHQAIAYRSLASRSTQGRPCTINPQGGSAQGRILRLELGRLRRPQRHRVALPTPFPPSPSARRRRRRTQRSSLLLTVPPVAIDGHVRRLTQHKVVLRGPELGDALHP